MLELIAYFFAGCLLVNGVPHFVQGVSGHYFQSPFARPPGIGESSPQVNVLWGAFNFIAGTLLLCHVGSFVAGYNAGTTALVVGGIAMAYVLAGHFGKVRNN